MLRLRAVFETLHLNFVNGHHESIVFQNCKVLPDFFFLFSSSSSSFIKGELVPEYGRPNPAICNQCNHSAINAIILQSMILCLKHCEKLLDTARASVAPDITVMVDWA